MYLFSNCFYLRISTSKIESIIFYWRPGVVVVTAAQLRSIKGELKFCAGSKPAHDVSEICSLQ